MLAAVACDLGGRGGQCLVKRAKSCSTVAEVRVDSLHGAMATKLGIVLVAVP